MKMNNRALPLVLSFCTVPGLTAGVRYTVSVYAVTTMGISKPSSVLVYSKEKSKLLKHDTPSLALSANVFT